MSLQINKIEETKADALIIAGINNSINEDLAAIEWMIGSYTRNFEWFWSDPINISNFLGVEAIKFFIRSDTWRQAIQLVDPEWTPMPVPPQWSYAINADGSVTVEAVIIPEPEPTPEPEPEVVLNIDEPVVEPVPEEPVVEEPVPELVPEEPLP